jgi:hypothetical protein
VSSDAFTVGLVEVETMWTLLDLVKAHDILDTIEEGRLEE